MPIRIRLILLAAVCSIAAGCATPLQQLHSFKAQYREAASPKALYWATFGDGWAAGAATWPAASSNEEARQMAKAQCELKAAQLRIFSSCRPYFLNDEFVLGRVSHYQALRLARGEPDTSTASTTQSSVDSGNESEPELDTPSTGPLCAENGSCYGDISDLTGRPKVIHVGGYFRKDGTYVRGHYRSRPRR